MSLVFPCFLIVGPRGTLTPIAGYAGYPIWWTMKDGVRDSQTGFCFSRLRGKWNLTTTNPRAAPLKRLFFLQSHLNRDNCRVGGWQGRVNTDPLPRKPLFICRSPPVVAGRRRWWLGRGPKIVVFHVVFVHFPSKIVKNRCFSYGFRIFSFQNR